MKEILEALEREREFLECLLDAIQSTNEANYELRRRWFEKHVINGEPYEFKYPDSGQSQREIQERFGGKT